MTKSQKKPTILSDYLDVIFHFLKKGYTTLQLQNSVNYEDRIGSPQGCGCKLNFTEIFENEGIQIMLASGIGNRAINNLKAYDV